MILYVRKGEKNLFYESFDVNFYTLRPFKLKFSQVLSRQIYYQLITGFNGGF